MAADTYNGAGSGTHGRMDGLRRGSRTSLLFHLGMASKKEPKENDKSSKGVRNRNRIRQFADGPIVH